MSLAQLNPGFGARINATGLKTQVSRNPGPVCRINVAITLAMWNMVGLAISKRFFEKSIFGAKKSIKSSRFFEGD